MSKTITRNKKVKNATALTVYGVDFKSRAEARHFKMLKDAGLEPQYESEKFILVEGFYPEHIQYYAPRKDKKENKSYFITDTRKIRDMTYTPDFILTYKGVKIYIESKGFITDGYKLKKKLFLNLINTKAKATDTKILFFEPHTIKDMEKTINIIKQL